MAAYIVIDQLVVTDSSAMGTYDSLAQGAISGYGGRCILPHASEIEPLEGNWKPSCIVLIQFADVERAKQWWDSAEYAEARALHHAATISNVILLQCSSCSPM